MLTIYISRVIRELFVKARPPLLICTIFALTFLVKAQAAPNYSAIAIGAINDRGNSAGRHYFELYGNFPGSTYGARLFCNGVEVPSKREYQSANQINLSIAELPSNTSCSFDLFASGY